MYLPNEILTLLALLVSAGLGAGLGLGVYLRNPGRNLNRVFGALAADVAVWGLGMAIAMGSHDALMARLALGGAFFAASFFPALYYHFTACFPNQRFEGSRQLQIGLYIGGGILGVLAFTPFFVSNVVEFFDQPPLVGYGPAFFAYLLLLVVAFGFGMISLARKVRLATGVRRRQLEHVFLAVLVTGLLGALASTLGWFTPTGALEVYAPVVLTVMLAMSAYSLVRYHLEDVWLVLARTALYIVLTGAVIILFAAAVVVVHGFYAESTRTTDLLSAALAAALVVLILQPIKERLHLGLDRLVLKRHYDAQEFLRRMSSHAVRCIHMDELLRTVVDDIQRTLGARLVRVVIESEDEPGTVVTEYSTRADEIDSLSISFDFVLDYVRKHPDPIVLERMLQQPPEPERMRLAHCLAELEAFLCVPLRTRKGVIGLLTLGHKSSHDIYSSNDVSVFTTLAAPLGSAIDNARLYRRLEEVNLHLERLMANMRGGVVACDTRGTVKTVNQGAREILGRVTIGQSIDALQPQLTALLQKALVERHALGDIETVITGPDGQEIPLLISVTTLQTGDKEPLGAMALLFNLTQIKRLEANVQRADRLSSLGTVAAGMAHEIKNPLVSIKTFTQLLPTRYEDEEFRETFFAVVPNEVERINAIVTRLLDFARPKPVVFQPQNLREILERALLLVENQLRKAEVRVTTDFPDVVREVHADEQQLHQVFLNLLLNAIEALKESDERNLHLVMTYDRTHLRPNNGPAMLDVECARVMISDTGCGIPREQVEQVFTPFFTTKANGSGLGLAVVHGIISGHHGEIDVSSISGVGTIITVTLPLSESVGAVEPAEA